MKLTELTDEELDRYCALAQGWKEVAVAPNLLFWVEGDIDDPNMVILQENYHPTSNKAQAFKLMEKFEMHVDVTDKMTTAVIWEGRVRTEQYAGTPQRAICLAVVASKYGEEVDDE